MQINSALPFKNNQMNFKGKYILEGTFLDNRKNAFKETLDSFAKQSNGESTKPTTMIVEDLKDGKQRVTYECKLSPYFEKLFIAQQIQDSCNLDELKTVDDSGKETLHYNKYLWGRI